METNPSHGPLPFFLASPHAVAPASEPEPEPSERLAGERERAMHTPTRRDIPAVKDSAPALKEVVRVRKDDPRAE